jgi:amino acid permease
MFVRAVLTLVGTIMGAGMFAIPAMINKMGLVPASVIYWIIAALVISTHLLFVEIISRTEKRMRLPGYVGKFLGTWAKYTGVFTQSFQLIGSSLIYLILGGQFLSIIAQRYGFSFPLISWQVVFWFIGGLLVLRALQSVAKIESALTWGLGAITLFMVFFGLTKLDQSRLVFHDWNQSLAPLGIFLFAMFGLTVIPEVHEIANRKIEMTRLVVFVGSFIAALIMWLFGIVMSLAIDLTAASDMEALLGIFPSWLWWILPVFGLLAVITSYITLTYDLKTMYQIDLKYSHAVSWIISLGAPLVLLFVTSRNLVQTIDTVGAVFTAGLGLLVVIAARQAMVGDKKRKPLWWREIIPLASGILFLGAIVQRLALIASQ